MPKIPYNIREEDLSKSTNLIFDPLTIKYVKNTVETMLRVKKFELM